MRFRKQSLAASPSSSDARAGISRWIIYYNTNRPHSTLAGRTLDEAYAIDMEQQKLAAEPTQNPP